MSTDNLIPLEWHNERRVVKTLIPFSANPRNIFNNLLGVTSDPLTEVEMREIAALDRNCRLIKGQVFLWEEGQSWEDLWDVNGEITPA